MYKNVRRHIFAPIALIAVSISSAFCADLAARDPAVDHAKDLRRETLISTIYAASSILRDRVLVVTVAGADASLVGKVGSAVEKNFAEQAAKSVDGITRVNNLIDVAEPTPPSPNGGDPSSRQKTDDATTTAAIRSKLLWSSATNGLDIDVVTIAGKVRLDGAVYSGAQKDLAGRIAADTNGVSSANNQIVVFSVPPLTEGARTAMQAAETERARAMPDAWITARVRSTLLLSHSVNDFDIGVATKEGVVSLSGSVSTPAARDSAMNLAMNTRGVRSVEGSRLKNE